MNSLRIFLTVLLALSINYLAHTQEKYAVLITGDYAAESYAVPIADQWNDGQGKGDYGFDEFWNDTFLMWEMLTKPMDEGGKGYTTENVFVLFANGQDFQPDWIDDRYKPEPLVTVTDFSASIANVNAVFNGLANGSGGFPQVTADDFLFVWTFDHGGGSGGNSTLHLIDGSITDDDFAALVNPIPANKKVYWMQQCRSGGFADELEGTSTFFHAACQPNQNAYRADNAPDIENEVISGVTYHHGEFNFHVYSPTNGVSPAGFDSYDGESYSNADLNNDNYISVYEAWVWESTHESSPETPLLSDLGSIGSYTSIDYPTLLYENIGGYGMVVSHRGIIGISKDIHVTSGNQLRFVNNAHVYLLNEARIIVDQGASLALEDNVTLIGTNANNRLVVNGGLLVGDNLTFTSQGSDWELTLNNPGLETVFENTTFENCQLINYGASLTIKNSYFANCNLIHSYRGNVTVTDGTIFDRTWLYLENTEDNLNTATVTNCIFITDITMAAIDLWNYHHYNITNNTIHGYYNGIQMFQSGYGELKKAMISDNTITNCTHRGILAYNTRGAFYRNHIYDNGYGVWLADHSNVRLFGDYDAQSNAETQEIRDNQSYEVYASQYSFPPYFRYNVIVDDDNLPDDPLVYHSGKISLKDVRYNCWEEIAGSFVAAEDLYTTGYMWQPMWCPGDNMNNTPDPDEDMYAIAGNLFEAEDYVSAKTMYQTLIDQFPESKYAKAAMQELFALEKFVANNYNALQQYYTTNAAIQSDTTLAVSAAFLSSKCDVKTQNWPDAISYYENIILAPESMEDSIFAIINLGYVYFMMENSGYKSAHTGSLAQYKPETKEVFFDNRDYLLSLLPGDQAKNPMQENLAQLKEGELLQNVPNPFKDETQIWYKLENESSVQLNIYNYTGQLISQINEGTKTKGTHQTTLNATGLTNGIYFYSISINGQTTDARKMTVMK
jgi:hypothetical protein